MEPASLGKIDVSFLGKTVGKNLINHALFCPIRRFIVKFCHSQLPFRQPIALYCSAVIVPAEERKRAVGILAFKAIVVDAILRKSKCAVKDVLPVFSANEREFKAQIILIGARLSVIGRRVKSATDFIRRIGVDSQALTVFTTHSKHFAQNNKNPLDAK